MMRSCGLSRFRQPLAARAAPEARSLAPGLKPWFSDALGKEATFDKRAIIQNIGH